MGRNVLLVEDDPRNILAYGYGPHSKLYPYSRLLPDAIPRKPEARLADKASLAFTTRTRLFEPFPRKQIFPKIISSFYIHAMVALKAREQLLKAIHGSMMARMAQRRPLGFLIVIVECRRFFKAALR